MRRRASIALLMMLSMSVSAAAGPGAACRIEAWSTDADPAGPRVRAAPSVHAGIIGRLPAVRTDEEGRRIGPTFRVLGAQDGWLHIAEARAEGSPQPKRLFSGTGWVHGSRAGLSAQSAHGYPRPDATTRPSVDLGTNWLQPEQVLAVLGCSGRWAKLRVSVDGVHEAWFRDTCANQWTTCDEPDDDR